MSSDEENAALEAHTMREDIEEFEHRLGLRMAPNSAIVAKKKRFAETQREKKEEQRRIGVASSKPPRKASVANFYDYARPSQPPMTDFKIDFDETASSGSPSPRREKKPKVPGLDLGPVASHREVKVVTAKSIKGQGEAQRGRNKDKKPKEKDASLDSRFYQDPILISSREVALKTVTNRGVFKTSAVVPAEPLQTLENGPGVGAPQPSRGAYQKTIDAAKSARERELASHRAERLEKTKKQVEQDRMRAAQIGEPYVTARLREEYKERNKPKPKQIVNTFKGEDEREAIEALGELDKRSKAIKNSLLSEVFAAESKREDAKRNRLTLPQIL